MTTEILKSAGLNVELAANDWGTLINRRAVKEPIEKGGWNIFHTWLVGPDMANPAINYPMRGVGEKSWFGWPTDPKMEELRNAWFDATDRVVELDSVGCCYVIPTAVYRAGARYADTPGATEHLAVCQAVRRQGRRVLAHVGIRATHAYLPDYGEALH